MNEWGKNEFVRVGQARLDDMKGVGRVVQVADSSEALIGNQG
jgi:hypothetical protein